MSIEKKSLISTLKTTKKANVASSTAPVAPEASHVVSKKMTKRETLRASKRQTLRASKRQTLRASKRTSLRAIE